MASQDRVPDAWDDDYEAIADAKPKSTTLAAPAKISRAERRAQHEQANKQLWESAENPGLFHIVQQNHGSAPPPASDFKPALKVLSRKPQPAPSKPTAADLANGVQGMALADDEDDSEEEARKAQEKTLAERQAKAALERQEKQRKYAEVRERLFGSPDPAPPSEGSSAATQGNSGGRSRLRGGGASRGRAGRHQSPRSQQSPSADQSPARGLPPSNRQLYDPNEPAPRPVSTYSAIEKRPGAPESPIRSPRGPDGSGRGGFGFAPRGNKSGSS